MQNAIKQILSALILLTRLPFIKIKDEDFDLKGSIWAFPLVGLLLASLMAIFYEFLFFISLPSIFSAILLAIFLSLVTGGFHEDGLADCFDGLGGHDKEMRLKIMRDSMIGSYGTLALVFNIILRIALFDQLIKHDLIWLALLPSLLFSRYAILWVVYFSDAARKDGIAQNLKDPIIDQLKKASILVGLIGFLIIDFYLLAFASMSIIIAYFIAQYATKKIDGFTGDVLGATEQISHLALLGLALAML